MNTVIFTKKKIEHEHLVISDYHSGYIVCRRCGTTFGRVYDTGIKFNPNAAYFSNLLQKNIKKPHVRDYLHLIYCLKGNIGLSAEIFNRSLFIFQDAIENIEIKNGTKLLYALSSIYYSMKEANCSILYNELLEAYYGKVKKEREREIKNNFHRTYHHLTKKLELKKVVLDPEHYLCLLSEQFTIDKKNKTMIKTILTKTTKLLPINKQMNSGIAAGAFYINSKMNGLKIPQEQIAEALKISTWAVCEYTKEISSILSSIYYNKRKNKLKNKDFYHLKKEIMKGILAIDGLF
jgi:transcription initiation factor TFIIIB Brf1 subunit/transcription initiation factor TFIIB